MTLESQAKTKTLAGELLRQLIFVAVIPIAITIGFISWQLYPELKSGLTEKQQSIAELVAQQTRAQMRDSEDTLDILFSISRQYPATPMRIWFSAFVNETNAFESMYLVNTKGEITDIAISGVSINQANSLYLGLDVSQLTIFQGNQFKEKSGWSKVFLSAVTGRLSIAYVRDTSRGTLIAELDINRLPQLSKDMAGFGTLVMILDSSYQLIAHPNPELSQMQINLSQIDLVKNRDNGKVHSDRFNWSNQEYFGTIHPIPDLDWHVIVAQQTSEMLASLEKTFTNWAISLALLLFAALALAYLRAKRFSSRFKKLEAFAGKVASGDYDADREPFQISEFQKLSDDLAMMAEAIKKRETSLQDKETELREINADLESRVEKRTQDLKKANRELQSTVDALNNTMEQLVQSEKLASLGSLVAGIAHELNTPIGNANMATSSLNDFATELRKKLDSGTMKKSELERYLEDSLMASSIATRNLEKASELIISFKQVATDQSSSQRRQFALSEIVHEILVTLHPQTKKSPVEIITDIPEELTMDSFPGPFGQVMSNLIINAILHGFKENQQGRITIEAIDRNEDVQINVSDTGNGIAQEVVGKVFDPFFTTRLGQGGSGLGLHICHNIVTDVLGGEISVLSSPQSGTTFTLLIPKKAPDSTRSSLKLN